MRLVVGTRKSELALWQANHVKALLEKTCPGCEVVLKTCTTKGDRDQQTPLPELAGRGVFTAEIEEGLRNGSIDCAVHSLKDLPCELEDGFAVGAYIHREDPRDVFLSKEGLKLDELGQGSVIGTSSLRRKAQLKSRYPHLRFVDLRGNLSTRVQKLYADAAMAGIVLAAAGVKRLGWQDKITQYLEVEEMLPAPGQGIIAVEYLAGRSDIAELLSSINDSSSQAAAIAERGFLSLLDGGCQTPLGAFCVSEGKTFYMRAMLSNLDASNVIRLEGRSSDPLELAASLAEQARSAGAEAIIAQSRNESGKGVDTCGTADASAQGCAFGGAEAPVAGKVILVGAGPGDPGLITAKGIQALQRADAVVYDRLISLRLLDYAPAEAKRIFVGKMPDVHPIPQHEINDILVSEAVQGKCVVRLKGGDPFVFGRGGEEALACKEAGIPFEVVPGVTSCIAAPAYAGIPVTHRGLTSSFHVITGHEDPEKDKSSIAWEQVAKLDGTLVFLMGVKNLPFIAQRLIDGSMDEQTPVALVEMGTWPTQRTLLSTLINCAADAEEASISNPAVILVGAVAQLRDTLSWLETKPLFGKRIALTRAAHQVRGLSSRLEERGAAVYEFPTIATVMLDNDDVFASAVSRISDYAWLIFTSPNGVHMFFKRFFAAGYDVRDLSGIEIAAVGCATHDACKAYGLYRVHVPRPFTQEALAQKLRGKVVSGDRVLIARALVARKVLENELVRMGAHVDVLPVYETVRNVEGSEALCAALAAHEIDGIAFTSSSSVKNALIALGDRLDLLENVDLFSIGPATSKTILNAGLKVSEEAAISSIDALSDAIELYWERRSE